jgi:tRNA G37 N-methylase Trm5
MRSKYPASNKPTCHDTHHLMVNELQSSLFISERRSIAKTCMRTCLQLRQVFEVYRTAGTTRRNDGAQPLMGYVEETICRMERYRYRY